MKCGSAARPGEMTTERESDALDVAGVSACAAIMVGAAEPACICAAYFGTTMPAAIAKAAKVRTERMTAIPLVAVTSPCHGEQEANAARWRAGFGRHW